MEAPSPAHSSCEIGFSQNWMFLFSPKKMPLCRFVQLCAAELSPASRRSCRGGSPGCKRCWEQPNIAFWFVSCSPSQCDCMREKGGPSFPAINPWGWEFYNELPLGFIANPMGERERSAENLLQHRATDHPWSGSGAKSIRVFTSCFNFYTCAKHFLTESLPH